MEQTSIVVVYHPNCKASTDFIIAVSKVPDANIEYINIKEDEIQLIEGNPKNPYIKKHESIYNMKGEGVIAFNGNGD